MNNKFTRIKEITPKTARQILRALKFFNKNLYLFAFFSCVIFILVDQPYMTGFITHHHGWVSSHNLANTSHGHAENYFVGFSLSFDYGDRIKYSYFRRSMFLNGPFQSLFVFLPTDRIAHQMYLAFQFMNVAFLLSIWLAFCLLRRLIPSPNLAMAACLFAFSNYFLAYYRDISSPDNLSIMSILLIIYGTVDYRERARRWVFYLCGIVGVCLGWGFSSLPVLGLWLGAQVLMIFWALKRSPLYCLKRLVKLDALWVFIIGLGLVGGSLLYASSIEKMRIRQTYSDKGEGEISVIQRSLTRGDYQTLELNSTIFGAAERRQKGPSLRHPIKTKNYWRMWSVGQRQRIKRSFLPYSVISSGDLGQNYGYFQLLFVFCLAIAAFKWNWSQRMLALMIATSGILWMLFLPSHATPHNYTAVNYVGIPLIAFAGVMFFMPRWSGAIFLIATSTIFIYANHEINELKAERAQQWDWQAPDFQAIADLVPRGKTIYYDRGVKRIVPRAQYSHGFFLTDRHIGTELDISDYAISKNRRYGSKNLTPKNKKIFLFHARDSLNSARDREAKQKALIQERYGNKNSGLDKISVRNKNSHRNKGPHPNNSKNSN